MMHIANFDCEYKYATGLRPAFAKIEIVTAELSFDEAYELTKAIRATIDDYIESKMPS